MEHTCDYCGHTASSVAPNPEGAMCFDEDACVGRAEKRDQERRRERFKAMQAEANAAARAKKEV